jgi:prolyl-tRNA synthetase
MIQLYKQFVNNVLCIDVLMGEKTIGERFAGADNTYTLEAFMQDGQTLQCATSHYLGQNFAKAYEIKCQSKDNKYEYVYQTSAGASTRLIGAIIMSHGDDKGLVLPFDIAPIQIMVIVINSKDISIMKPALDKIYKSLHTYRFHIDDSDHSFGYKIAESEVQGVPLNVVVGAKDLAQNQVTLISRNEGHKQVVKLDQLSEYVERAIKAYQQQLFIASQERLVSSIVEVDNLTDFNKVIKNNKIALAP